MPSQALVNREPYDQAMYQVEISFQEITSGVSSYWWNLYQIKTNELWRCDFDSFEDWLGDFSVKPFGQSRATFYAVMSSIERFQRIGKNDEEIRELLGKRKVALEGDFKDLFLEGGRGEIRPEVAERIAAGGETVQGFVDRVADLAPGEARQAVRSLLSQDKVYVIQEEVIEQGGRLLINMVWENDTDGIIWKGTVTVSAAEIVSRPGRTISNQIPEAVSRYIQKRFGIRS